MSQYNTLGLVGLIVDASICGLAGWLAACSNDYCVEAVMLRGCEWGVDYYEL